MTDRDDIRIGDAERDEMMTALREHYAQGRLTLDELDERLDRALAARTVGDLARIADDLPDVADGRDRRAPDTSPAWRPGHPAWSRHHPRAFRHRPPVLWSALLVVLLVVTIGGDALKVLFFVWLAMVVGAAVHHRHHHGHHHHRRHHRRHHRVRA